ncbi:MAG: hypothetical protein WBM35_13530 [Candidatus Electrothrix sp.]
MFTLITGCPGSWKTSRLLQLSQSISKPIFHNMPEFVSDHGIITIVDDSYFRMSIHDYSTTQIHNSAFFLDEAHLLLRDFSCETDVTGFIENHCAYGIDIYVAVQNIRQIPACFLPSVYRHEFCFRNRLFNRFGFLTYSSALVHRTSPGLSYTNQRPFCFRRVYR